MGNSAMTTERAGPNYTAQGKEILRDGEHFADVCTEDAARAVATVLNCDEVMHSHGYSSADLDHMEKVLWA